MVQIVYTKNITAKKNNMNPSPDIDRIFEENNEDDMIYNELSNKWHDAVNSGQLDLALGIVRQLSALGGDYEDEVVRTYEAVRDYALEGKLWALYDRCEEQLKYWTDNAFQEARDDYENTELKALV